MCHWIPFWSFLSITGIVSLTVLMWYSLGCSYIMYGLKLWWSWTHSSFGWLLGWNTGKKIVACLHPLDSLYPSHSPCSHENMVIHKSKNNKEEWACVSSLRIFFCCRMEQYWHGNLMQFPTALNQLPHSKVTLNQWSR